MTVPENTRIKIFDTTLRHGDQSPGCSLHEHDEVQMAHQLAKLGVDVIEGGFPIAAAGDFRAVERIAKEVRGLIIVALARTKIEDIDRAWEAVKSADRPR